MTRSVENTLLGCWLSGQNLEDAALFKPEEFENSAIFKRLAAGENLLQIIENTGVEAHVLAEMMGDSIPTLYANIITKRRSDIHLQAAQTALNDRQYQAVQDEINALQALEERPRAATGLTDKLNDLVSRRREQKIIYYGVKGLDPLTLGLHAGELTTIGARPSVGKSALALQIALNVYDQGQKVLFFPLEMSTEQTLERMAAMLGFADPDALRTGKIEAAEKREKYENALKQIGKLEKSGLFKIYEGVNDIHQIEQTIKGERPFLVVIDQLTQLQAKQRFNNRREQFSYMTATLKRFAMRYRISVLLLAQINRLGDDVEPVMAHLKESGSIEEDSDNVILLHRIPKESTNNPAAWSDHKRPYLVKLTKQRSGPTGDFLGTFYTTNLKFFSNG